MKLILLFNLISMNVVFATFYDDNANFCNKYLNGEDILTRPIKYIVEEQGKKTLYLLKINVHC